MDIQEKIEQIKATLPANVQLIAVSKTKPIGDIEEAYRAGQRTFGENRPQEMAAKCKALPRDIEWHMIGHLQEKNVKYIAPFVTLIHSVDSLKLLRKIDREAEKNGRNIPCLLEFHIAEEESKSGLSAEEAEKILESEEYRKLAHVRIDGVMGIATNTGNRKQVRKEFRALHAVFERLREKYFSGQKEFKQISMGMSGDYRLAIEEGSTMVRIGSSIFGERTYLPKV